MDGNASSSLPMRKAAVFSLLQVIAAVGVYWHLVTGGWLTEHYRLDDANIVNLALAIFEPLALVAVAVFWWKRTRTAYRLLFWSWVAQFVVAFAFLAFFVGFMLFWRPRLF